jgi:hypothetical protein
MKKFIINFTGCGSIIGQSLPKPTPGFKWIETSPQIIDYYECQCGQGGCYQAHQELTEVKDSEDVE